MVSLSWLVIIDNIIFTMRRFFFCYIWIGGKDWWFDMGYSPPDYSYTRMFIEFFVVISVKHSVNGWLYELHQIALVFNTKLIHSLNISFAHHICFCFIVCNYFNCFIDQRSKMARFITWQILTASNCVQ